MCSSHERSERSTLTENRQLSAAAQEIARRRLGQQASQASSYSPEIWPDASTGSRLPLAVQPQDGPQRPHGSSAQRNSRLHPVSPAVIDLSDSPRASGSGSSGQRPTSRSAATSGGSHTAAIDLLQDEISDDDASPDSAAATARRVQAPLPRRQQQPKKLNRLRKAGGQLAAGDGSGGGGATSARGAPSAPVRPAPVSSDGAQDLLASFGGLQVHRTCICGACPPCIENVDFCRLGNVNSQQLQCPSSVATLSHLQRDHCSHG